MHKITFFPLGNADTCFIELENGRLLILDYAHVKKLDDQYDLRWDIETDLRSRLKAKKRDSVDVFCVTHIDRDHVCNACDFFHLDYSKQYQGEGRITIDELWVPAGVITEEGLSKEKDEHAWIWRQEARFRLKEGTGIRVFGRPERLRTWIEAQGLKMTDREHLITDAGTVIPGFSLSSDSVEFFLHSPHAHRIDEREVEDRNQDSVVMQGVFNINGTETKVIFAGDAPWEAMGDISRITMAKGRSERLEYSLFKLPHHCSYLSLSDEKGETKTVPKTDIDSWFKRAQPYAWLVSSSHHISDEEQNDPPHFQAKNYYVDVKNSVSGRFWVTMEEPTIGAPKPLSIKIDSFGISQELLAAVGIGGASVVNERPPQAG